ncbi:PREDICTED: RNA-directed DNA polymerase from mobile element jockey-like [Acropora digitifera]|uniref:RNA-directed DNA polymerase from mobile element jockey-like n=1 Tax=Acropora digitifera TaxID=70779 RepID=UPI00077A0105|nr:PREDICTED: RNA-directed DNA polymerase from mobile element jockey-like [Acropora digitifera]
MTGISFNKTRDEHSRSAWPVYKKAHRSAPGGSGAGGSVVIITKKLNGTPRDKISISGGSPVKCFWYRQRPCIRSGDAIDWNNFKRSRNNVNNTIKIAKKSYYSKSFTACVGNSRKTWEIINEVTGRKSEKAIINELEFEDKKLTDPTEIAEGFNKLFAEIGPKLSENIEDIDICFDEFVNQSISGNFSFQQISPSLVSSYLRKLCIRKATGLYTVSARLLRECFDLISDSLALIFNRSIETSIFPDEWKSARITPLYKKCGNRSDPSNYRPISIIPVVAKVFERIAYDQVYRYLTEYKLLYCYQSGFRTLHSTVTALIEATDSWSLNVDRGLVNAVVFLDLKKAFDTVNHAILLSKLQSARYDEYSPIISWLSART